jgi:hypothetical protein
MAISVWEYIRRRTADAVLAGCRDALELMESQDQGAAMWSAAKALRQQLHDAKAGNGGATSSQHHSAPASHDNAATPATQPAQHSYPSAPTGSVPERRKVGRPRKEVHG